VSCWTGNDLHVGVDVEVVMDPDVRSGFGVVEMTGVEAEPKMDILTTVVEGGAGENVKVMFDDDDIVIEPRLFRRQMMQVMIAMTSKMTVGWHQALGKGKQCRSSSVLSSPYYDTA
jgi:hypothetical protein